jgi:hypothetical protein
MILPFNFTGFSPWSLGSVVSEPMLGKTIMMGAKLLTLWQPGVKEESSCLCQSPSSQTY